MIQLCTKTLAPFVGLLCMLVGACGKDPSTTPLNQWPMIMAHDAATTYLDAKDPINYEIYRWTITQPPLAGTSGLLNCGVRGFDWRPKIDEKTGNINMHHGPIEVKHSMQAAMSELVDWAANRTTPSDLIWLGVTDCEGDNCTGRVQELFDNMGIRYITDCSALNGLTVADAMKLAALPNGGHVLATFDCWEGNYDPSIACSGHGSRSSTKQVKGREYNCWNTSKTNSIPFDRMFAYLDKVDAAGPPSDGQLFAAQMIWQASEICTFVCLIDVKEVLHVHHHAHSMTATIVVLVGI